MFELKRHPENTVNIQFGRDTIKSAVICGVATYGNNEHPRVGDYMSNAQNQPNCSICLQCVAGSRVRRSGLLGKTPVQHTLNGCTSQSPGDGALSRRVTKDFN